MKEKITIITAILMLTMTTVAFAVTATELVWETPEEIEVTKRPSDTELQTALDLGYEYYYQLIVYTSGYWEGLLLWANNPITLTTTSQYIVADSTDDFHLVNSYDAVLTMTGPIKYNINTSVANLITVLDPTTPLLAAIREGAKMIPPNLTPIVLPLVTLVVGSLGLRKGLAMLFNQLRGA